MTRDELIAKVAEQLSGSTPLAAIGVALALVRQDDEQPSQLND